MLTLITGLASTFLYSQIDEIMKGHYSLMSHYLQHREPIKRET